LNGAPLQSQQDWQIFTADENSVNIFGLETAAN
jgi:hypothetical protein